MCLGPANVAYSLLSSFNAILLSVLLLVAVSMFDFIGYFHTCCSSFLFVMHMFSLLFILCAFAGYLTRRPCLCARDSSSLLFWCIPIIPSYFVITHQLLHKQFLKYFD